MLLPALAACIGVAASCSHAEATTDTSEEVENWSSTHKVTTKQLLKPESTEEVDAVDARACTTFMLPAYARSAWRQHVQLCVTQRITCMDHAMQCVA